MATTPEAKVRKRGQWLCRGGWGAFAAALAMPAVYVTIHDSDSNSGLWVNGWDSMKEVFRIGWDAIHGRGLGPEAGWTYYYSGFALANVILLGSPVFVQYFRHDLRRLRASAKVLAAASLYAASLVTLDLYYGGLPSLGSLHVGYYAWLASFGLVTAGLHLLSRPQIQVSPISAASRTSEERRAIQELDDYLHGANQQRLVEVPASGDWESSQIVDIVNLLQTDEERRTKASSAARNSVPTLNL